MSECEFTVRTASGKLRLSAPGRRAFVSLPDGKVVRLRSARQLRMLESVHGRVPLQVVDADGSTVSTMSRHSTGARTADTGARADTGLSVRMTGRGVSVKLADRVASVVERSPDPVAARAAVDHACLLLGGGANRWMRQLLPHLWSDPVGVVSKLALLVDESGRPAAGLVPRDLRSALQAADIVGAARGASVRRRLLPMPAGVLPEPAVAELLEKHDARMAKHTHWAEGDVKFSSLSGYKLHVYCADEAEVRLAVERLASTLLSRNLGFKTPTSAYAATDQEQARKGVTVYLPERERAADDVAAVVAALGPWPHDKAPGDDLHLVNGVGLRFELAVDPGRDVSFDSGLYHELYAPALYYLPEETRGEYVDVTTFARQMCDDRQLDVGAVVSWCGPISGLDAPLPSPALVERAALLVAAGVRDVGDPVMSIPDEVFDAYLHVGDVDDRLVAAYRATLSDDVTRSRFDEGLTFFGESRPQDVHVAFEAAVAGVTPDWFTGWVRLDGTEAKTLAATGWDAQQFMDAMDRIDLLQSRNPSVVALWDFMKLTRDAVLAPSRVEQLLRVVDTEGVVALQAQLTV